VQSEDEEIEPSPIIVRKKYVEGVYSSSENEIRRLEKNEPLSEN